MTDLHIPNLTIKNFRGINHLEIPRLGRVTLIAGRNGVGKSTILDAIRFFCASASGAIEEEILSSHDEPQPVAQGEGFDIAPLFPNENISLYMEITTDTTTQPLSLTMMIVKLIDKRNRASSSASNPMVDALRIKMGNEHVDYGIDLTERDRRWFPKRQPEEHEMQGAHGEFAPGPPLPPWKTCIYVGPRLLDDRSIEYFWGKITLLPDEELITKLISLATEDDVAGIRVVPNTGASDRYPSTRILARLTTDSDRIPLQRLGDGAVHLFAIALALANCRDGILLLDEIENGVHHTLHPQMWSLILQAAQELNVQVVATTHSLDCIHGFAKATTDQSADDVVGLRLEKAGEAERLIAYDARRLHLLYEQDRDMR